MKRKISITINDTTLNGIDSVIDGVFIRNRSQAIENILSNTLSERKSAVILCGGAPDQIQIDDEYRPTVKIKGKAVVEYAVKKLKENGFTDIFIVAKGEVLTKIFNILKDGNDYGIKLQYIEEKRANGTFDSLKYLSSRIKTKFLVVYGDLYFNSVNIEAIWNHHLRNNSTATIMMTTSSKPSEKGTLKVEGSKVLEFTQKPNESNIYLVFSPIFACDPEIFNQTGKSIEGDVFPNLAKKGLLEGHLSSEKEIHIHIKEDIQKV